MFQLAQKIKTILKIFCQNKEIKGAEIKKFNIKIIPSNSIQKKNKSYHNKMIRKEKLF